MMRHNRKHYDRTTGKFYTLPFRRKPVRKDKYESKAYREYQRYLRYRYDTVSLLFSEHLHTSMQRIGFMRLFMDQKQEPIVHTEKYLAYMKEAKVYSRHLAYIVPEVWMTWEEENEFKPIATFSGN